MRTALLVFTSLACAACGTTATIHRTDGVPVVGHIRGGDAENLYVDEAGARTTIPRSEIKDISHPGTGATIAGGILFGYGIFNVAIGLPMCKTEGDAFCVGVFTPLALGVPILLWGLATHASSVSAASTPLKSDDTARFFVSPIVPTDSRQPAGVAVGGAF
jgi:hypothetical protein